MRSYLLILFCLSQVMASYGQVGQPSPLLGVNSAYDEQAPVLSPDGGRLYFTIAKHPQNIWGEKDPGDVWYATPDSLGNWQVQGPDSLLNNRYYNAVLGFSASGDTIYLHGQYSGLEAQRLKGISYAIRQSQGWSQPTPLKVKFYRNQGAHQSGTVSPNGRYMLLSLEAFSTRGAEDLYIAFLQPNGIFAGLKNLGSTINTPFQEMSPFLAPGDTALYFASNGHGGQGRDLYVAYRQDDSWTRWTTPEPLGEAYNGEGVELFYFQDRTGEWAYFTSNENSEGYGDIYQVRLREEDTTGVQEEQHHDPLPKPDTILYIPFLQSDLLTTLHTISAEKDTLGQDTLRLADQDATIISDTLATIPAEGSIAETLTSRRLNFVIRSQLDSTIIPAQVEGRWADFLWIADSSEADTLQLMIPDSIPSLVLTLLAPGYFAQEATYHDADSLLFFEYFLEPLVVGAKVNLETVLFRRGTSDLLEAGFPELDKMVRLLQDNPQLVVELGGHTDNRGSAKANLDLSEERVRVVKGYLVAAGIAERRIEGKGYGGTQPIADNRSEDSRRLNRRVELKIIGID